MWNLLTKTSLNLPAELAHWVAVSALHYNIGPRASQHNFKVNLGVKLAGLEFANPLGLAAGFDKNATCFNGAMNLGFGHVEVGTVTPKPQPGNSKPRVFRLPEEKAVINRYGFNSQGMDAAANNLRSTAFNRTGSLGGNVGANNASNDPINDYRQAAARLAPYADYIALNISSPNTPGLRNLQTKQHLANLLMAGFSGCRESGFEPGCRLSPICFANFSGLNQLQRVNWIRNAYISYTSEHTLLTKVSHLSYVRLCLRQKSKKTRILHGY